MNKKKMIKMKSGVERVITLVLTIVVLLNVVSCGAKKTTTNNAKSEVKDETILVNDFVNDEKTNYSIVKFGHYEQDGNKSNGAEEIEWLVLDVDVNNYLLLSRYVLDSKNFNEEQVDTIYANSTLRKWLNEDFIGSAFSAKDATYLDDTSKYSTKIMKDDKVSILDKDMCSKYFGKENTNNENMKLATLGTEYAKSQGLQVDKNHSSSFYNHGSFLLSDNGENLSKVVWVGQKGHIYNDGQNVKLDNGDGVRPIICLKKTCISSDTNEKLEEHIKNPNGKVNESKKANPNATPLETKKGQTANTNVSAGEETDKIKQYSNVSNEKTHSATLKMNKDNVIDDVVNKKWVYGRTPVSWIYVEPNKQIISNWKPHQSKQFAASQNVSSGNKGCFLPILSNTNDTGTDYEGRFLCYQDAKRNTPEEMKNWFTNGIKDLTYRGYNVEDLLSRRYYLTELSKGISMADNTYINVVYCSELDDIIKNIEGK